jgi:DNA invertase Pin-like site-specific DNA recombinase
LRWAQIGYARGATGKRDLTAQCEAWIDLGVEPDRIYITEEPAGRARARPGLGQALAALHEGDTGVAIKLERVAGSSPENWKDVLHLTVSRPTNSPVRDLSPLC